jgi:hypothetical protein
MIQVINVEHQHGLIGYYGDVIFGGNKIQIVSCNKIYLNSKALLTKQITSWCSIQYISASHGKLKLENEKHKNCNFPQTKDNFLESIPDIIVKIKLDMCVVVKTNVYKFIERMTNFWFLWSNFSFP